MSKKGFIIAHHEIRPLTVALRVSTSGFALRVGNDSVAALLPYNFQFIGVITADFDQQSYTAELSLIEESFCQAFFKKRGTDIKTVK